jgi:hypothetical protein
MSNMRMILLEAALVAAVLTTGLSVSQVAYAAPLPAAAEPQADVKIDSLIKVERTEQSENGDSVTALVDPATVKIIPGDKLLFVNRYENTGKNDVTGFVLNNPVHKAVAFIEALEDWALVSVDGGQNFGKLSALTVKDGEQQSRPAVAGDVSHIRWVLRSPIKPGASGELRFRGTVK